MGTYGIPNVRNPRKLVNSATTIYRKPGGNRKVQALAAREVRRILKR